MKLLSAYHRNNSGWGRIYWTDGLILWQISLSIMLASFFFILLSISLLHLSIENGWFNLESTCTGFVESNTEDFEKFKRQILGNEIVPCNSSRFTILNISLAGWNFIFSLSIFLFLIVYIRYIFRLR